MRRSNRKIEESLLWEKEREGLWKSKRDPYFLEIEIIGKGNSTLPLNELLIDEKYKPFNVDWTMKILDNTGERMLRYKAIRGSLKDAQKEIARMLRSQITFDLGPLE